MAHVHQRKSNESRSSAFAFANILQFIQYILLTPTYINVLNIYAFCNTHDITWGTKGDDKAEKLPSAHLKPGGKVDVNIPQDDGDLNAQYEAELYKFSMKPPKEVTVISEEEKQADYYKGFRSAVVLAWVFCNFALGAVVLSAAGLDNLNDDSKTSTEDEEAKRSMIYMQVVLWSVAGLSMFKFIGAMWYLVVRMVSYLPSASLSACFHTNVQVLVPRRLIHLIFQHDECVSLRDIAILYFHLSLDVHLDLSLNSVTIPRRARSGKQMEMKMGPCTMCDDFPRYSFRPS